MANSEETVTIVVYLKPHIIAALELESIRTGKSINDICNEIIRFGLKL